MGRRTVFELPQPRRYRLQQAPLAQALMQVRFPLVAHFQELAGVAGIQDRLLHRLPYMQQQQVQRMAIAFGPGGIAPSAPEGSVVWRFASDSQWTLLLEPGAASLFVGDEYRGIEDFADRFSEILIALHRTERVLRCDRLGVRYLNIVESLPGNPRAWTRWFRGDLVGWIGTEALGAETRLHSAINQVQTSTRPVGPFAGAPADVQARIRHGVVPAGTEIALESGESRRIEQECYVIDLDLFIQAPQPFDPEMLIGQFKALHAQIDAFFHWSLTEEGAQQFGVEEL